MCRRIVASTLLASALLAAAASAQTLTRINFITFKQAAAPPGVLLPPGTYEFELDAVAPNVVRVTSDRRRHLFIGMTVPVDRHAGLDGPRVLFGEAAGGQPTPIRVWYPARSPKGYQFLY